MIIVHTDGSCSGNPGPGGYAAIIQSGNGAGKHTIEIVGRKENTTNNKMELTAVIAALAIIRGMSEDKRPKVKVLTDSDYVARGIQEWLPAWRANGWKNKAGKKIKNRLLWTKLHELTEKLDVEFEILKSHSGHPLNERADQLARAMATGEQI